MARSAVNTLGSPLQGTAALAAVALLVGVAFGLSTLVTPLYVIYQKQFGFSQITLTLIYAAYVIGNLAALLFLGPLSDHIGRRITALVAIAVLVAATLAFLFANGLVALYLARICTGLGVGMVSGAGNAWLADLVGERERARAALIGTSSNFVGLGAAPLLSGLLAQYAPRPLQFAFLVYLLMLLATAALVWVTPERVARRASGRFELRPRLALPREIRAQFVAPAITGFGLMALVGFFAALMPTVLSRDLNIDNHAAAGGLFFELAAVVAAIIVATQSLPPRTAMILSLALMTPAAVAVAAAQFSQSLPVMLAATAGVGVTAGLGYRGGLQVVNHIAPETQRAAVISAYFVCCFIGNALPVIGVAALSRAAGAPIAVIAFACTISAFALVALVFGLRNRR